MSFASCLLGPMCLEGKSSTCGSSLSNLDEERAEAENSDLEFWCCCSSDLRHVLAMEAVALRRNMAAAAVRDMSSSRLHVRLSQLLVANQVLVFAALFQRNDGNHPHEAHFKPIAQSQNFMSKKT